MKKIILIYPSLMQLDEKSIIPPLSLIYIGTPLKGKYEVRAIDQRIDPEWRGTLRNELAGGNVLCAGISTMSGPQISGAIEAAAIIREDAPSLPIVFGGVHPSLLPEETLRHDLVDFIVIGDGEDTFRELVEALQSGTDKRGVRGIAYKEGHTIVRTPPREDFPTSHMEHPDYDIVEQGRYNFIPPWSTAKTLPVQTSRGCPMRCSYCYNTEYSRKTWRSLSPEQTVSLLARLSSQYRVNNFSLLDDNFFVNIKRVRRICELIIERGLPFEFHNVNCRADTIAGIDNDFLSLIKQAGIRQLFVGIETGSGRILSQIKKDITIDQILTANRKMKEAGIQPFYSFMAGFPSESLDDVKKTLSLMNRLHRYNRNAIVCRLQLFTPFPGTELYNYAIGNGHTLPRSLDEWASYHYERVNYRDFDKYHMDFLEDMNYYTNFMDRNVLTYMKGRYPGFIAALYARMLNFRIEHNFYSAMYELYPLRLLKSIRKRL